jgi:hypothetical protein
MVAGIDFDTNAIYLCAVDPAYVSPCISTTALRSGGGLIEAIAAVPTALAFCVGHMNLTPGTEAWVERGTGFSRKGDWPLGAIAGAIIATWPRLVNGSARIVTTADWKKNLGAPGNCNKQTANHYARLHWQAHFDTTPPTDHNMLDAYAIAVYAYTH